MTVMFGMSSSTALGMPVGVHAAAATIAGDVVTISADGVWQKMSHDSLRNSTGRNLIHAASFELLDLNENALLGVLNNAPLEFTPDFQSRAVELTIPKPDGGFERFAVVEAPVMHPDLAAQFPNIKTYRGQGIDQPAATIRLDYTPLGFHAQVLSPDGQYYVDPYFHLQTDLYMSYYKHDLIVDLANADYNEALYSDTGEFLYGHAPQSQLRPDEPGAFYPTSVSVGRVPVDNISPGTLPPPPHGFAPDFGNQLRSYRLAVAATGEYTNFWGGTVAAGQAAIVTAINRVTGVYENEVSVRMVLVANNSTVVYTNPSTDPYTNNNGFTMLSQNQSNLDSRIGNANYDVGHVFSTGGGGVALLGVIGQTGAKAQGVTGLPAPVGDGFYIDFVAHEMGHQFGANHSFNGTSGSCSGGNRNGSTAYEPGSGSTIMGYAGICGGDNLQAHSDAMFHSISIDEIRVEVTTGTGGAAATVTNNGNTIPVVSAGPNYVIPDQTPFELTATGMDADGDSLTYSWEQRNLGPANSVNAPDNGASPIFRAWLPTSSPTRVLPRFSNVLAGNTVTGEKYPTTNWSSMNFRVVLRDNRSGGGGVVSDDMSVRVVNSGSGFDVNSQATPTSWTGLTTETVTWNVSGTNTAPISTPTVDILFALDRLNYDTVLASGVPNTGSHDITVPNVDTSLGRVMVKGAGNIFFDINRANIIVASVAPILEGIDFGPVGQAVFGDYAAVSDNAYNSTDGFGWLTTAGLNAFTELRGNNLVRDKISVRNGLFQIDLPNGDYNIGIVLGVVKKTDPVRISIQGQSDTFTPQPGPNVVRTYEVNVPDGELFIEFDGLAGLDNTIRVSGISIDPQ